jgi:hypothetical protein
MKKEDKDLNYLAEGFAQEYQELVQKYYGKLESADFEPFGMRLREILPVADLTLGDRITTTNTISIPWDTDPADSSPIR